MILQNILVAVVALAAASYLARQTWRTWASSGCSGGCCKNPVPTAKETPLISTEELLGRVRRRSGEPVYRQSGK
jgi:hypothetical protein